MMKKIIKFITSTFLIAICFFSSFFLLKPVQKVEAASNGVSIFCDYESCFQVNQITYATISRGNLAYANILIEDSRGSNVTVYYHTVSGSAVGGVDYVESNSSSVSSRYNGDSTRIVAISVKTELTNISLQQRNINFEISSYLARSFFVVIDRAVYDDGTELPIISSQYNVNGKTIPTSGAVEMYLKSKNELAYNGDKLVAYNDELSYSNSWSEIPCETGRYGTAISSSNSEMGKVASLGLAKYYATGSCWLSEPQDSDEELTRFCIGNETWTKWGGATYGSPGEGWFFGAHINAYRTEFGKSSLVSLVEKNNDRGYWMSTGAIDVQDYVKYDGTYWFYNNQGPYVGYSLYRQYETDGEISMGLNIRERLMDTTLPTVTDLYLDTTSLYATQGIYRLAVRFSEPVRNATGTKIFGETNLLDKSLEFKYAGGEGSDTLYYDCDTNVYENLSVKRITFSGNISSSSSVFTNSGFVDFRNIKDYGGNSLDRIGIDTKQFNVSLDKRVPYVEVEQVNFSSNIPQSSPTIPVNLMQFTSGTFYYEWIKEDEYDAFLGGNDLNSFAILNKLKQDANNASNTRSGFSTLRNTSLDEAYKTQVTLNDKNSNGNYVLICYIEPQFAISDAANLRLYKCGPYLVDNEKPTFSELSDDEVNILESGGFNRKFSFKVSDNNGIDSVTALVKESNKANAKVNRIACSIKSDGTATFTLDLQSIIDKYYLDSEGKPTVNADAGFFDINFEIKDKAGNIANVYSEYQKIYLSIQPYFDAEAIIAYDSPGLNITENIYSLGTVMIGNAKDADLKKEQISVSINDEPFIGEYYEGEDYSVNFNVIDQNHFVYIAFHKPGYYRYKFQTAGSYSDTFDIYITDYFHEFTENYNKAYSNELLLVNKAIQISENVQFLFINSNKQIEREFYGGAINPTFSSEQACLDFLRYYEYQDLRYEVLTTNTASYLNTGSGEGYNKAVGEEKTAMSGQVWIRYKRASWNVNSESINDWAYYFYKESDDGSNTINIQDISKNLSDTIDSICNKICSKAGTNPNAYDLYLVDDEHLDEHSRAPYLNENQIALSRSVTYDVTKTGSNLLNATYHGDPNLFENKLRKTVGSNNLDLPIATNLKLSVSDETKLFIAPYTEGTLTFVPIKAKEGMTLRDAINSVSTSSSITCSSGVYVIREVDKNGGCEFYVYVDADAPRLGIKLNDSETIDYIDSKEVANLFASQLAVVSVGDSKEGGVLSYTEIDKSAYVAFFTLPGQKLYSIYYRGEIPQESIPEGSYLVHVGDRSGNFFAFKIYVSNSAPKIEFKPYDTKIVIKISNRSSDELQSLEIYCNDVLLSTALNPEQEFTQNGNYRVVVKDKYSNTEYTEAKDFSRLPPQVQFKYEDEGFFPYTEGNTSYMIIRNQDTYQLISTSRRLQIIFQSENSAFEIKGLQPADYIYYEQSNILEIKSLLPFYIDVWNTEHTEDVISYKIVVDNTAPNIAVTTDNPKIVFDESDQTKYESGNTSNPSSIKYGNGNGVNEDEVLQDQNIFNDYVCVNIDDDTSIKEVKVYQNDELIKTYTVENVSNETLSFFIANVKGKVKIVATDLFGTSTSFEFNFVEKKISNATIGEKTINPSLDTVYYGSNESIVECQTNSEVHLMYFYNGAQVNQIFKYVDGKLYIGNYQLSNSKYGVVDFYNGGIMVIGDNGEKIYYDKPVTLDINNTYKPFEDFGLSIVCDSLTGNILVKFEASETANKLAVRVNRGASLADYYEIELSKEDAKINFDSSADIIISDNYIYSSTDEINITFDLLKISNISVAFNPISNDFIEQDYIYTISNMFDNGEGYYSIKSTNVYGITTNYYLIYSKTINASIELSYEDKPNEIYSIGYSDSFYANGKAVITGYKLNKLEGLTDIDQSKISSSKFGEEVTLIIEKSSMITIEDLYGNKKVVHVVIDSDPNFAYKEENNWVNGFDANVDSTLGYSKNKLSIDLTKQELDSLEISQIKIINGDNIVTLYGYDGLNFIDYIAENFNECIGLNGTDVYEVMFVNKFGDVAIKEIHYSEEPTLIINRQTSSSVKIEEISLNDALTNGVWSNREINLSSSLDNNNLYKFYLRADGEANYRELALPYDLQLASTSQNGTLKYFIKYEDAYGYSYELSCTLNRQDIVYSTINMDFITINQVEYTKDPVVIKFDSNCVATYKLDLNDEVAYTSEQALYNDGSYTITIKDYSGNLATITFVKDSSCKFMISSPDGLVKAYSGGVINTNQLVFDNLGDTSFIKTLRFNGEIIKATDDMSFTKTGFYEIIVEDSVKNSSYFSFYLINHSISEFNYTVPSSYVISEVYRTHNDMRTPFMDAVNNTKTQLNLSLEGKYDVILRNIYQDSTINFEIEINKDEPKATLVGCENGEVTTADISIKDVDTEDVVEVYRNGELIARYDDENKENFATITQGGDYKIVVTNIQGVSKTLTFVKKNIANASLSILIIVLCILTAGGFFIGLLFRNRSKFDD